MTLIAIDPGIRGCGVAVFRMARLMTCAYVKNAFRAPLPLRVEDAARCAAMAREVFEWFPPGLIDTRPSPGVLENQQLVVEFPQVYQGGAQKGDPNDLLLLAGVVSALAALCSGIALCTCYRPKEWKGQVPKHIHQRRIEKRLTEVESERVTCDLATVPASLRHNAWDAIGLGLFALDRT